MLLTKTIGFKEIKLVKFMKKFKIILLYFLLLLISNKIHAQSGKIVIPETTNKNIDVSLKNEIDHSIKSGLKWLYKQQEKNGSWQNDPAITSLALSSFLRYGSNFSCKDSFITAGFNFLKKCIKSDGGIYLQDVPNYTTSICLMAFKDAADNLEFHGIIDNAEKFLIGLQYNENNGYTKDSIDYGGVDYGYSKSPDVSNLQWAIEALQYKETNNIEKQADEKSKEKGLYYGKALNFLSKCQNLKSVNNESYSGDDGGFMYSPGKSKAGGNTSYGSMTYAGLKSMIYLKVDKNDNRVIAAYNWIKNNYSVDVNPNLGDQGIFYYYHTFSTALSAYGEDNLIDNNGIKHNWRTELADHIIKIQNEEGWWQNQNARFWENNKVLVTTYCILSMEELLK